MKKLTPMLVVDEIEKSLPFWVDRLGFQKTMEVPHGDTIGFCILVKANVELMLQGRASVSDDIASLADLDFRSSLYIEVEDLSAIEAALEGLELVFPRRQTFYGSQEVGTFDPAGNVVVFAQFG